VPNHFDNETPWYGAVSNRQFPNAINLGLNQLNYVRIISPPNIGHLKERRSILWELQHLRRHKNKRCGHS
jgi:hypothetical protein